MRILTPLFGYLGKSNTASTPEEGDTKILVPGAIQPVLRIPFPFFTLTNSAFPGGVEPINSWIYQQEFLYNVSVGVGIAALAPGLWCIQVWHDKVRAGAINDLTSHNRVDLLDTNTGTFVTLTKILNDVAVPESYSREFWMLIPTDQAFSINRTSVAGAGTGTCLSNVKVVCTRYI